MEMPHYNEIDVISSLQTDTTLLDVTCCVRLHSLLYVVACCWELLHKVSDRSNFWTNNSQHFFCSVIAEAWRNNVGSICAALLHCWRYARAIHMVTKVLWVVSFPRCTAGPNVVRSCCTRLQNNANTDATTPNIIGPAMLDVVAPVCS